MPVIKNKPLPDTHPCKNGCVVFGQKRLNRSSEQHSDINRPETEEDGYRQEQLRREKIRRLRFKN